MEDQIEATEAKVAEPNVTLDLTVNDVNLVLAALQELPHKVSDPMIRKIMEQAQAQLAS
jgi:hypothetical protein